MKLYTQLADDSGDPAAQHMLGLAHFEGLGVEINFAKVPKCLTCSISYPTLYILIVIDISHICSQARIPTESYGPRTLVLE